MDSFDTLIAGPRVPGLWWWYLCLIWSCQSYTAHSSAPLVSAPLSLHSLCLNVRPVMKTMRLFVMTHHLHEAHIWDRWLHYASRWQPISGPHLAPAPVLARDSVSGVCLASWVDPMLTDFRIQTHRLLYNHRKRDIQDNQGHCQQIVLHLSLYVSPPLFVLHLLLAWRIHKWNILDLKSNCFTSKRLNEIGLLGQEFPRQAESDLWWCVWCWCYRIVIAIEMLSALTTDLKAN